MTPRASRLTAGLGLVLLTLACALPCSAFAQWAATGPPYQDPTPAMLQQQAADISAAEHALVVRSSIGAALFLASLVACAVSLAGALRHRRVRRRVSGLDPAAQSANNSEMDGDGVATG